MKITHSEVRQQLAAHLSRLWRYGMVLSRNRDVAEELVQSTCVRALDEQRRQYQKVMQRVGQLPEAQRNAVFLVYVEGFTYQEAADTLMVPVGTIMSRLAAARATLARQTSQAASAQEKHR